MPCRPGGTSIGTRVTVTEAPVGPFALAGA